MARLLIVDDDLSIRQFLTIFLRKEGHDVTVAENGLVALEKLQANRFDIVLTDIRMPRMGGLDLLDVIKERKIPVQAIVMTAYSTTETALEAMRKGAYDYLVKPFQLDEVHVVVDKCLEKHALTLENKELRNRIRRHGRRRVALTYVSTAMQEVDDLVRRVAPTPTSVLLLGESGTGKEVVARMLHAFSQRAEHPFIAINCGAIPEQLMESELFGHAKGAFTGATKDKQGLFEAAGGGTLFLDEIGELGIGLQVKLLRVLQERTVTPVGSTREVPIDVRVVAATHKDLRGAVQDGRFRPDLYYRLNVIEIRIPPLRERRDDILPLARHFLREMNQRFGRELSGFTAEAEAILGQLLFPGNVRELENVVERAVALELNGEVTAAHLPDPASTALVEGGFFRPEITVPPVALEPHQLVAWFIDGVDRYLDDGDGNLDLDAVLADLEAGIMRRALDKTAGNKTEAAQRLAMSFRSFRYKLAKHEDDADGERRRRVSSGKLAPGDADPG